ncbi:hypothetical protein JX265_000314 [Neoarthrinium moseri]|uniref:Uncharacterized protein n=1 Tax=Neoarthrinium moseri TaxID=1658444 RepID=A0A9Q0AS48_9PEZI|nr:uncharacterized protein JN550_000564 [Neoarthrinium moseri]KAI1878382.1 hypothetical protein JN550_000564 [Neoarthrinium moseri]KAI1881488.1 hypothetical protein JX265_000314 [Neoarthrinium moseri]
MRNPYGDLDIACVYNCRTTNAWEDDIALTVTVFPRLGLTFGLLFGCTDAAERDIIQRLPRCKATEIHPMLLPGIFAELERCRQIMLVEDVMDDIEATTFQVNHQGQAPDARAFNNSKRARWLDTAFVRNSLVNWITHLRRMIEHIQELENSTMLQPVTCTQWSHLPAYSASKAAGSQDIPADTQTEPKRLNANDSWERPVGIRETSVETAIAAGNDSRQMRSIAIVTMIFLPGTFFASMFSMSFFSWEDTPFVSDSFWIYILLTVTTTAITLGCWYYISVKRRGYHQGYVDEEACAIDGQNL